MADQALPELPSDTEIKQTMLAEVAKEQQHVIGTAPESELPPLPAVPEIEPEAPAMIVQPEVAAVPQVVTETLPETIVMPQPVEPAAPVVAELPPVVAETITTMPKSEPLPPQPKVVSKTRPERIEPDEYDEPKKKKRGIGCSCRMLSCGGCLLLLALIAGIIFVIVTRPPAIVDPVKVWLNNGLQASAGDGTTNEAALADLSAQASTFKVGDNSLVIREGELQAILQSKYTGNGTINVDMQSGKLKVFVDGDNGSNVPLWIVGEVSAPDGENLKLTKIGTERVAMPAFMNDFLTRAVFSVLNLVNNNTSINSDNLLSTVLPLPDNIKLKSIQIADDQMTIVLNLSSGLENIFGQ